MIYQTLTGGLGADPVEGLSHFTGKAALNTLMITLLISPIARRFKLGQLVKVRRLIGLYSFFGQPYTCWYTWLWISDSTRHCWRVK